MKKIFAVVAITALALVSCYIPSKGAGSITFVFPGIAEAKAIGDTNSFNTARVYMLSAATDTANAFLDFGDGAIFVDVEINVSNDTATVEGIPAGNWDVLLALGSAEGASDTLYVQQYGNSGPVNILPGIDNQVNITISPNPFITSSLLFGNDVVGVAFNLITDEIFTATGNDVYTDGTLGISSLALTPSTDIGTASINNISIGLDAGGNDTVYLSTSNGIWVGDGDGTWNELFTGLSGKPILHAGAYLDTTPARTIVYYQRDGGLGGINLQLALEEIIDIDLSSLITGQPVHDFEINDDDDVVYFASKIGAFALDENLFDGGFTDATAMDAAKFFDVIDGTYKTVQSIAYDSFNSNMYIGTDSGIYEGTPQNISGANEPFASPLTAVPGTPDTKYDKILVSPSGDYVAFLSNMNLYVMQISPQVILQFPFYSGLPGSISEMAWTSADELLISGSEGLVLLDVSTLSF